MGICGNSYILDGLFPALCGALWPVLVLSLFPGLCLQPEVMIPELTLAAFPFAREDLHAPGWFVYLIGISCSLSRAFLCNPKALDAVQRALM